MKPPTVSCSASPDVNVMKKNLCPTLMYGKFIRFSSNSSRQVGFCTSKAMKNGFRETPNGVLLCSTRCYPMLTCTKPELTPIRVIPDGPALPGGPGEP